MGAVLISDPVEALGSMGSSLLGCSVTAGVEGLGLVWGLGVALGCLEGWGAWKVGVVWGG